MSVSCLKYDKPAPREESQNPQAWPASKYVHWFGKSLGDVYFKISTSIFFSLKPGPGCYPAPSPLPIVMKRKIQQRIYTWAEL